MSGIVNIIVGSFYVAIQSANHVTISDTEVVGFDEKRIAGGQMP
jgi:hypothetical protein